MPADKTNFPKIPGPVPKPDDQYGLVSNGYDFCPQKLTTALHHAQTRPARTTKSLHRAGLSATGGFTVNGRVNQVQRELSRSLTDPKFKSLGPAGFEIKDPRFRFLNPRKLPQLGMVTGTYISGAPCSAGPMADECSVVVKDWHATRYRPPTDVNWAPSYWPTWWPPVAGGPWIEDVLGP
jgi:hypothetical protein